MKKKSFTLLEMLVVLGIIGVILSVLTLSFSIAQKKSRDSKRKGDLRSIQSGLEQYYSSCYVYPTGSLAADTPVACETSPPVISVVPVDPKDGSAYIYGPTGTEPDIEGFSICTVLESDVNPNFCLYSQQ